MALKAIIQTYGSIEKGFVSLLKSGEPMLIKFAWGHAVGNPKDTVDVSMSRTIEQIQIIKLPDNNRG